MNWGFIGFGKIAKKFLSSLNQISSEKVVAIGTRSGTEEANRLCPKARIYSTYTEVFEDTEVDIVYINTTHNYHVEQTLEALKFGKHVICEKPIALHPNDVRKIMEAKGDRFVMEALWTRFLPAYQQMKAWVDDDRIGKIRLIKADFAFASTLPPEGRLLNPKLAGGAMYDIGIYPLSLVADLTHDQIPSQMNVSIDWTDTKVDGSVVYQLQFRDRVTAQLFCSVQMNSSNEALIIGTKGYIRMPLFWKGQSVELYTNEAVITKELRYVDTGYYHEILEVIECINEGKKESTLMSLSTSKHLADLMNQILTDQPMDP